MKIPQSVKTHAPEILTGLACVGVAGSVFAMYRTAPSIRREVDAVKRDWNGDDPKKTKEDIVALSKALAPSVGCSLATIGLIIGSNRISAGRVSALTTLLSASVTTANSYRDKVIEKFGAAKDEEIRSEIAKENLTSRPQTEFPPSYLCPNGYHCYESYFGHPFSCTRERLGQIQNELGKRILGNMFLSVNEVFAEMGIPAMDCGDGMGFTVDNPLEFRYSTFSDEFGDPVLDVSFAYPPVVDFDKMWTGR